MLFLWFYKGKLYRIFESLFLFCPFSGFKVCVCVSPVSSKVEAALAALTVTLYAFPSQLYTPTSIPWLQSLYFFFFFEQRSSVKHFRLLIVDGIRVFDLKTHHKIALTSGMLCIVYAHVQECMHMHIYVEAGGLRRISSSLASQYFWNRVSSQSLWLADWLGWPAKAL